MADNTVPPASEFDADHPRLSGPLQSERLVKIICIGAGASGLLFAYKLQRSFSNFELTIYEKNVEVSGTWYENRYPGCACDIPAHTYTWSFEPNPEWSSVYAGSKEIHGYFNTFADKYNLRPYCKLRHEVIGARWVESRGGWDVEVLEHDSGARTTASCDILINASGILNAWRWPDIPGLHDFKGPLLHTAKWDDTVELEGKHVGLIGNGSSGIQILPAIHPKAREITTFIRGPTWVSPVQGNVQHFYSEEERHTFATVPGVLLKQRKTIETALNSFFPVFKLNSAVQRNLTAFMVQQMKDKLQDEELEKQLIPTWGLGCRRTTAGIGYMETLKEDNVHLVSGDIERVTAEGCVGANGQLYPVDVLICATGFDVTYRPRFLLIGQEGKNLSEEWALEPKSYFGLSAAGFPNYFMFIGPNSPIGNGPVLCAIEAQADYMLKFVNRWQTENIHAFSPKPEAIADLIAHKDNFMKDTVWTQNCRSWYKRGSATGSITALWPGSTLHYLEAISNVRYDDWNVVYSGNRFAYLGNGLSQTESDQTADWAYYVRERDDGPYLGNRKVRQLMNKSGTVVRVPPTTKSGSLL